jgi:hypothetical protein
MHYQPPARVAGLPRIPLKRTSEKPQKAKFVMTEF